MLLRDALRGVGDLCMELGRGVMVGRGLTAGLTFFCVGE